MSKKAITIVSVVVVIIVIVIGIGISIAKADVTQTSALAPRVDMSMHLVVAVNPVVNAQVGSELVPNRVKEVGASRAVETRLVNGGGDVTVNFDVFDVPEMNSSLV